MTSFNLSDNCCQFVVKMWSTLLLSMMLSSFHWHCCCWTSTLNTLTGSKTFVVLHKYVTQKLAGAKLWKQASLLTITDVHSCWFLNRVKGHQDYDVAFRALPLPAQLNIEADKLAGQHSSKSKQSTRRINTIKGSGVIPHYAGETINSEYKANIQKIWTHPEIKKNIREGQEWNAKHNLIDWTSHGIDVKNNYNKKLFVVKQIHDWLP